MRDAIERHIQCVEATQQDFYQVVRKLQQEVEVLKQYKAAYEEWQAKTEFIQEMSKSLPVGYLGWHRADVLRDLLFKGYKL